MGIWHRQIGSSFLCVSWVFFMQPSSLAQQQSDVTKTYAIAIHGGAGGDPGKWDADTKQRRIEGVGAALDRGIELLKSKAAAVDVVEAVVRLLEDDPTFNAGRGCVLNERGEHELDASIMDGSNLRCGAVAGIRRAKNPISVARRVMSDTKHILLGSSGADEFAEMLGLELQDDDYFRTERQKSNWQLWKNKEPGVSLHRPGPQGPDEEQLYLGTVGCVVLDSLGNLAAATSTGGLMGKRWGRVGDSPIIGAGNYADNGTCAVSGTGVGEEFIRHNTAADIAARMRYGKQSLSAATQAAIARLPEDCGGVIAVDGKGNLSLEFNTPGMTRAAADSSGWRLVQLGRE